MEIAVTDGEAFLDACAALAILASPASDSLVARHYSLRKLESPVAAHCLASQAAKVEGGAVEGRANAFGQEDVEDFRLVASAGRQVYGEKGTTDAVLEMTEQKAVASVLLAFVSWQNSDEDSSSTLLGAGELQVVPRREPVFRVLQLLLAAHDDRRGVVGDDYLLNVMC